jgi:hypothetical protein
MEVIYCVLIMTAEDKPGKQALKQATPERQKLTLLSVQKIEAVQKRQRLALPSVQRIQAFHTSFVTVGASTGKAGQVCPPLKIGCHRIGLGQTSKNKKAAVSGENCGFCGSP